MRTIQILVLVLFSITFSACGDNVATDPSASVAKVNEVSKINCASIDMYQQGDTCMSYCSACGAGTMCVDSNGNSVPDKCVPLPENPTPTLPPVEVTCTVSPEVCGDNIDNNCDGQTDEGCWGTPCVKQFLCGSAKGINNKVGSKIVCEVEGEPQTEPFIGQTCDTFMPGVCLSGAYQCGGPFPKPWATCLNTTLASQELCGDNIDNNCDGQTDEVGCKCAFGEPTLLYVDSDDDGFGTNVSKTFCVAEVTPYGYATQAGDCNDSNSSVHPGLKELCNSIDDNCDGVTDSGCNVTVFGGCYKAHSAEIGQGCSGLYGVCAVNGVKECGWNVDNTVGVICSTDVNGSASKMVDEVCGDNLDNDCNGQTDEGCDCPDVKMLSAVSDLYANYCNKCTGECKTLPNIPIDATSFKLVVVLKDLASEDKLFAINEYIPNNSQNIGKVSTITAGTRVGVIDLDPKTSGIWYAICNLVSVGGCQINPVQTSQYVTEFFPALADEIYLIKDQQWIDLTSKMKPGLSSNSSVHGEVVTF